MALVHVGRGKQLIDVAVFLDDVDYLKTVIDVAEEDDIPLVRRTADIGPQFRSRSAERAREVGKSAALLPKFPHKTAASDQAAALAGDVFEDIDQISEPKAAYEAAARLEAFLGQLCGFGLQRRVNISIGHFTALGNRLVEEAAQSPQLLFAFLDQTQAFAHHFARGAVTAVLHDVRYKGFPALTNGNVHATPPDLRHGMPQ